jgi:hypothetical protein
MITINLDKAKAIHLERYNSAAISAAKKRAANTLVGITNTPDDATFLAQLNSDRTAISNATSTSDLQDIKLPE